MRCFILHMHSGSKRLTHYAVEDCHGDEGERNQDVHTSLYRGSGRRFRVVGLNLGESILVH
jgi:hypothetical protein